MVRENKRETRICSRMKILDDQKIFREKIFGGTLGGRDLTLAGGILMAINAAGRQLFV